MGVRVPAAERQKQREACAGFSGGGRVVSGSAPDERGRDDGADADAGGERDRRG